MVPLSLFKNIKLLLLVLNSQKWLLSVYKFTTLIVLFVLFFFLTVAQSPDHHLQREGRNILKLESATQLHRTSVWIGRCRS